MSTAPIIRRLIALAVALAVFALAWGVYALLHATWGAGRPITVGVLHSRTGPLAASEQPLAESTLMAIAELNAAGGLLGRPIKPVVVDGRSDPATFAAEARRLVARDKVSVIFGGYTSACRKAVRPVLEEFGHLLIYPPKYEGLELSPNIVYTGGPANQLATPSVSWCREALKAKTVFLVGTDDVSSRGTLALAHDNMTALGMTAVGEEYLPADSRDVGPVVDKIRAAAPDAVISHLKGESNAPFYGQLRQAGLSPDKSPVLSLTLTEEELRRLPPGLVTGHYSAANYFQTIDRRQNQDFVRRFKRRNGQDRVTSDPLSNAYNGVWFWAQAVTEAESADVESVRRTIRRQTLDAPEGVIAVDHANLNGWRAFFVGKARADGQFDIVYSLPKPIPPSPFPRTRPRAEWEAFVGDLNRRWGGRWAAPAGASAPGGATP